MVHFLRVPYVLNFRWDNAIEASLIVKPWKPELFFLPFVKKRSRLRELPVEQCMRESFRFLTIQIDMSFLHQDDEHIIRTHLMLIIGPGIGLSGIYQAIVAKLL